MIGPQTFVEFTEFGDYPLGQQLQGGRKGEIHLVPLDIAVDLVARRGVARYSTRQASERRAAEDRERIEQAHEAQRGEELVALRMLEQVEKLNVGEVGFFSPAKSEELIKARQAQ